ncbi:MAG: Rrf2 family transcriptional regulator [Bacteroidales bacterium]|nr:Rrf2 family transcriptional regulator [Bacteroidales bacterium]
MSSIVKFSEAASIGLHGTVLIAKSENFLNVNKIAEKIGSSRHHVAKVMQRLAKDGYIRSMRGPTGGFVLLKKPEKISFLDVYESVEGKVSTNDEYSNIKETEAIDKKILKDITKKMTQDFINYMKKQHISDYI